MDEGTLGALRALLGHDDRREPAAVILTRLGESLPRVADIAVAIEDREMFSAAAGALVASSGADAEIREYLVTALSREPPVFGFSPGSRLVSIVAESEEEAAWLRERANHAVGLAKARMMDVLLAGDALGEEGEEWYVSELRAGPVNSQMLDNLYTFGPLSQILDRAIVAVPPWLAADTNRRFIVASALSEEATRRLEIVDAALRSDEASMDIWMPVGVIGRRAVEDSVVLSNVLAVARSDSPAARAGAAAALAAAAQMQPEAQEAVVCLMHDESAQVRVSAVDALGALPNEIRYPHVQAALVDESAEVKLSAIRLVSEDSSLEGYSSELDLALGDADERVRGVAAVAVAHSKLVPMDTLVAPLLSALADQRLRYGDREAAAIALRAISAFSGEVESGLVEALHDRDDDVRRAAAQTLGLLGRRFTDQGNHVQDRLCAILSDPAYSDRDKVQRWTGQDYAFEGLRAFVTGLD